MKGGKYSYTKNEEWLTPSEASNFRMINALTNVTLNKFKTVKLNVDENVKRLFVEADNNLEYIENVHGRNSNREKLLEILSDEDSGLIIKKLIHLRYKLDGQVEKLHKIVEDTMDIDQYNEYISNPQKVSKKFLFENFDVEVENEIPFE